jgi:imidazolonepropionase-like amidohydrolase
VLRDVRAGVQAAEPVVRALRGVTLFPAPDAPPIADGIVLVQQGRIVEVAKRGTAHADIPPLAPGCDGGVVMAGFQNSHVHLNGPAFSKAATAEAATLEDGLTSLLTRYGVTTAFDIASDRDNTLALRKRLERGELKGPPDDSGPAAVSLPGAAGLHQPLRPRLPGQAAPARHRGRGADHGEAEPRCRAEATKLFLVTPQGGRPPKRMAADIAASAAAETHRRGRLVFAHPTDLDGVRAALSAKVDILAHPPLGVRGPWPAELMDAVRAAGVSMAPTLKLLRYELAKEKPPPQVAEPILQDTVREFGRFAAAGGKVLFGADVDFMADSDPTEGYELLAQAGLSSMQTLASLTTTPAVRWNEGSRRGRLSPGMEADITVLQGDPAQSARHVANVKCTLRAGRVIFSR